MDKKAYGFTVVELLIVIVVIAILAAISFVAYRGIQDRANASSASSKVSQIAKKILVYYTENETYPDTLSQAGIDNVADVQYSYNNTTSPKTYCVTATTSNKSYYLNNTTRTSPTEGGCAGHGQGGQIATTNHIRNPDLVDISQTALNYAANATRTVAGGAITARVTSLLSPSTATNGLSIIGTVNVGSLYSAKYRIRGVNGAVGKTSWAVLYGGAQRAASGGYVLTSEWQEINVLAQSAATVSGTHLYILWTAIFGMGD